MLKWGTVAATVAWAFGVTPNLQSQTQGARGLFNRMQNSYYSGNTGSGGLADYAQQAAAAAGIPGMGRRQSNTGGEAAGGILGDLMQDPMGTILGEAINFISPEDQDKMGRSSKKKRQQRKEENDSENESKAGGVGDGLKGIAGDWVAGIAGKAWESFNSNQNGDRLAENKQRN